MTTQEHLAELDKHGQNTSVIASALRHLLQLQLEREAAAKPEPPTVPDPKPGEVWAGSDGWRAITNFRQDGAVWFVKDGSDGNVWLTLASWHRWVRETGGKRIWPVEGGK